MRCGACVADNEGTEAGQTVFFSHVIITFHREVSVSTTYDIYSNLRSVEECKISSGKFMYVSLS